MGHRATAGHGQHGQRGRRFADRWPLTIKNNGAPPVAVPVTVPTGSTIGAVSFGSECTRGGAVGVADHRGRATVTITVPFTATATTGMLRVTTSPTLPSQIIVDGTPSDSLGRPSGSTWRPAPTP